MLGIAALVNAFVDHFGAILRGYERFGDEAKLNASRAVLTATLGFVSLYVGRSLTSLCAALAAASLGSCAYGIAILFGSRPRQRRVTGRVDRLFARSVLRHSIPIWIAGFLSLLYFKVDTLFLQAFAGDAELGAYGAAYKFFEGAMIVPAVLLAVAFPKLSRAHRHPEVQRRLEWQLGSVLFGLGLTAGAACFFGGDPLVKLTFGADFGRAVASLKVLAWGLPLLFLNFGLTHFLLARDMGRATSVLALAMLVLNVGLNLSLVPQRSGPGAALATVLTEVALTLGCFGALRESDTRQSAPRAARTDQKAA
jgi:polysaccharide transporter, PST family